MISNITLYINKIREIVDPIILSYKTHVRNTPNYPIY
jgi:hypothetical protein